MIKSGVPPAKVATVWRDDPALVRPMAASTTDAPPDKDLQNPALVYEPKFDGIRALVSLEPATGQPRVRLWSRNGNDKTSQFPEVVKGLREFALRLKAPVLLDGEVVALDARGEPGGFQQLQGRMHLKGERDIAREATAQRAAFIAFDILRDGGEDLRPLILTHRRARLERIFGASGSSEVRHGEYAAGDGRRLYARAIEQGWEGLVAKRADSRYESDRRSPSWIKLKIKKIESLVVGGWTEPRETRKYFGALVLGAFTGEAPRREAALRRPRRQRLHRSRADAHRQDAARVRHRAHAVRRPGAGQRSGPLDRAEAGRRGHVHRLDQRAAPAPRRVSGAARRRRSARASRWRRRACPNRRRPRRARRRSAPC